LRTELYGGGGGKSGEPEATGGLADEERQGDQAEAIVVRLRSGIERKRVIVMTFGPC
jgi:ribosomal protein L14